MLKLRTLLMASAIAACATAAVAQTAAPPADPAATPAPGTRMIPIPCTDFSKMAFCNDPLVQARAGKTGAMPNMPDKMGTMPDMNAPEQPKQ